MKKMIADFKKFDFETKINMFIVTFLVALLFLLIFLGYFGFTILNGLSFFLILYVLIFPWSFILANRDHKERLKKRKFHAVLNLIDERLDIITKISELEILSKRLKRIQEYESDSHQRRRVDDTFEKMSNIFRFMENDIKGT